MKTFVDKTCSWFHKPPFLGKYAIVATTAHHGLVAVLRTLRTYVVAWGMVCLGEIGAVSWGRRMVNEERVMRRIRLLAENVVKVLEVR